MDQDFVPYQESVELKELSFDELCLASYETETNWHITHKPWRNSEDITEIASPLYQQAFRWFRDKHGYDVSIVHRTFHKYKFEIQKLTYEGDDYFFTDFSFQTHNHAELECLKKLIHIVKNR